MRFHITQPPRARDRRVVRGRLVQLDAQEAPQRQRVGEAPPDAALRVDAFEVADQQAAKVQTRRQRRPSHLGCVELLTAAFDEGVEAVLVEQRVKPLVERMCRCAGHVGGRDPELLLVLSPTASSHRHKTIVP